ncbi:hypothetical protein HF086_015766 [Spodoptera exigua]|uniref:Uncharacterized protein n=1 Tax=Spodoptera exigua TaxID=7107 RepID=A0A922M1Y9_SPOEX|nr:hypothetical protein HF086_015766 [Spodoptera exigua]
MSDDVEDRIRRKSQELMDLMTLREEQGGFTPKATLARTPPQGFSTPLSTIVGTEEDRLPLAGEKRALGSPEEVQEVLRRRFAATRGGRADVPPMGGLLTRQADPGPASPEPEAIIAAGSGLEDPLAVAPTEQLAGLATGSTRGIMEAVRGKTSKLNKDEIATIGAHTERLGAVITHLIMRLVAAERAAERAAAGQAAMRASTGFAPVAPSAVPITFADALRLGKGSAPVPIPRPAGPSVAIYPAEGHREELRTADDTRRLLRTAVKPQELGIQIAALRKVGNAGIVVETTSAAAAEKLKRAVPDSLRAADPVARRPLIALTGLDRGTTVEGLITDIKEQNLMDQQDWTLEKLGAQLKVLYKRTGTTGERNWRAGRGPAKSGQRGSGRADHLRGGGKGAAQCGAADASDGRANGAASTHRPLGHRPAGDDGGGCGRHRRTEPEGGPYLDAGASGQGAVRPRKAE